MMVYLTFIKLLLIFTNRCVIRKQNSIKGSSKCSHQALSYRWSGRPEQAGICVDLIRAIIARDIIPTPLLGVCLGHQAIVVALVKSHSVQEISHGKQDTIFHQQKFI